MSLRHLVCVGSIALAATACASSYDESADVNVDELSKSCATRSNGPVQGVDVSKYQGSFNWNAAHVDFGYARLTDGMTIDPDFRQNWDNMATAGVRRGAYQFLRPALDIRAQAQIVIDHVGTLQDGDMPVMLDLEVPDPHGAASMAAKVGEWLTLVEAGTGKRPIIYTGAYFWQDNVKSTAFGNYPIWIAAYGTSCPSLPSGWSSWLMWQYSDGNHKLDHDIFNGTLAQLKVLAGK